MDDFTRSPEHCPKCKVPLIFKEKHRRHSATREWIGQFSCRYCGWTQERIGEGE